jgi:hypothetical protein
MGSGTTSLPKPTGNQPNKARGEPAKRPRSVIESRSSRCAKTLKRLPPPDDGFGGLELLLKSNSVMDKNPG